MKTLEKTITENELIAQFMDVGDAGTHKSLYAMTINGKALGYYHPDTMLYNSSWDWLIPVVHKCLHVCHEEMLNEWEDSFVVVFSACNIEMMYNEAVEFIEWYNDNN